MAKWGEGDPRWLVENRMDGKNVNGWHWEEKNKFQWSKSHLEGALPGLCSGEEPGPLCRISNLKSITGEASVSIRKGSKKLAVFDLKLELEWEYVTPDSDKPVKGKIEVTEFASAHDEEDYIFTVTVEGSGQQQQEGKKRAEGLREDVYKQLRLFAEELAQQ